MSLSQDTQTQPFSPLCLNLVQSQADEFISIQKKSRIVDPLHKQKPLITHSYVVFGALFNLRMTISVCIFGNDTALLYFNFQNNLRSLL